MYNTTPSRMNGNPIRVPLSKGLAWVPIRRADEKARDFIGRLTVEMIEVYTEPALLINAVRNTFRRKFISKYPANTFQVPSH